MPDPAPGSASEVFRASLALGCTSFGGPIAHLGYFERAYVRDRRWLSGDEYAALVGMCQLLPGPTSSQVGFLIGLRRAGWRGGLASWLGFTLPSALVMLAAALFFASTGVQSLRPIEHGLQLAAVAVVAQAVWTMGRRACRDAATIAIALVILAMMLRIHSPLAQAAAILLGAIAGLALTRPTPGPSADLARFVTRRAGMLALAIFLVLLIASLVAAAGHGHGLADLASVFYRAGALVFGGGHVVLPLLRESLVPAGWLGDDVFLTGYGLAQSVPGPLFSVAAYLGAATTAGGGAEIVRGAVCLVAIFLPGLLLAVAALGAWTRLARMDAAQRALAGIGAAVVGVLAAALYDPVWTTAVRDVPDGAIAVVAVVLLERFSVPPIAVVALCVMASMLRAS